MIWIRPLLTNGHNRTIIEVKGAITIPDRQTNKKTKQSDAKTIEQINQIKIGEKEKTMNNGERVQNGVC